MDTDKTEARLNFTNIVVTDYKSMLQKLLALEMYISQDFFSKAFFDYNRLEPVLGENGHELEVSFWLKLKLAEELNELAQAIIKGLAIPDGWDRFLQELSDVLHTLALVMIQVHPDRLDSEFSKLRNYMRQKRENVVKRSNYSAELPDFYE